MVAINEQVKIEATADFDQLLRGTKRARDELGRFTKAVDKADKEMSHANRTMGDSSKQLSKYARQLDKVEKAQRGMASGIAMAKRGLISLGVYMSVRQLQQYGDEWTNLRNRVKLFTKDQAETNKVVEALFQTSQETRQSVSATAEVYQRFAQANKQLGMSQKEMLTVMKTVNQTVAISGVSSASAAAALTQLGQGMSSGVLRGEELNSILEQTPRLAQAIAEGMGVNVGQLRALGAEGAITAQKVLGALAKERAKVQAEFEKTTPTIDQSLTTLTNSFGHFIDQLEQQYGIFEKIATGIGGLAKAMGDGAMTEKMSDFVVEEGQAFLKDAVEGWFGLRKTAVSAGNIAGHALQAGADFSSGVYRLGVQGAERYGAIGPETAARGYQQADLMNSGRTSPYMMRYGPSLDPNQDPNRSGTYKWGVGRSSGNPSDFMMMSSLLGGTAGADSVKPSADPAVPTRPTIDFTAADFTPKVEEDPWDAIPKSMFSASEMAQDFADDMVRLTLDFEMADRQAQMLAETEMDKLKLSQAQERQEYQSALVTEQQLEQLDGLHEAEQVKLKDTLDATKATEEAAEASATMAEGLEVANELGMMLGEIFGGSKGAQMVQNAMGLADAIAKQNPLGVFANTLGLVTTALSGTSDELNEFAESSDRLGRQLSAANKATQSATKGYLGEVEFDRQMEVLLSPIKHAFDTFAGESRLTGSGDLDTLANFFDTMSTQSLGGNDTGIMGDIRSFIEEMDNAGNTSGKENIYSYMLKLQALLGDDATLLDAAQNMFRLEESIEKTGDAAAKAAADMSRERSVRMEFDVEEMAMRKRAQGRMEMAGADPYLQNRVLKGLSRSIDNLRSRESASIRAARTGGSAKVTVGSGSGSGGSSSPTSPTTGVDGTGALVPEVRLNEIVLDEWADAVDVSNATPIDKNWNDIVPLLGLAHKRINPGHWWNVVNLKAFENNTINKEWNEVIPLLGMAHKRINPTHWENVINLPAFQNKTITKEWNDVVPLLGQAQKRINPEAWVNVIEVAGLNANPIGRNWDQVVSMGDKIGVNGWSDIFRFGQEVYGGGTAMSKMALGWGDVFNLDNLGTIDLDVGAAVQLVGERKKINIGDLIDMGALDGIITKSVNRAIRDRSVTVRQSASNSTSGTSTPSNSQRSNFRGPIATTVKKERLGWN